MENKKNLKERIEEYYKYGLALPYRDKVDRAKKNGDLEVEEEFLNLAYNNRERGFFDFSNTKDRYYKEDWIRLGDIRKTLAEKVSESDVKIKYMKQAIIYYSRYGEYNRDSFSSYAKYGTDEADKAIVRIALEYNLEEFAKEQLEKIGSFHGVSSLIKKKGGRKAQIMYLLKIGKFLDPKRPRAPCITINEPYDDYLKYAKKLCLENPKTYFLAYRITRYLQGKGKY